MKDYEETKTFIIVTPTKFGENNDGGKNFFIIEFLIEIFQEPIRFSVSISMCHPKITWFLYLRNIILPVKGNAKNISIYRRPTKIKNDLFLIQFLKVCTYNVE